MKLFNKRTSSFTLSLFDTIRNDILSASPSPKKRMSAVASNHTNFIYVFWTFIYFSFFQKSTQAKRPLQ